MTSVLRGLVVGAVLTMALSPTGTGSPAPADTGATPGRLPNSTERSVYHDPATGWEVTRLTRSPAEDIKIYQTHPSWTADGQWIIFHSNRSGAPQLFAVRETDGRIVKLTDTPGIDVGQVCLSRKRLEFLTLVGRDVVLLDLQTALTERERLGVTDSPPRAYPLILGRLPVGSELSGTMAWDASETRLYLGLHHPGQEPARAWSIACLNLEQGTWRTILAPGFRVGHVQTNPWDDGWLMFCHETGGDAPQRVWLARADGSGEARPLYVETFDEWVTHEVWWDVRHVLFTVWPRNDAMARKPHGLASVDLDGVVRFHSRFPYWHVTGASGSPYLVADTFDGRLLRVHRDTGERVVLTQGHRPGQGAHPHPTLDPTGQKVLFNSTAEGQADLYLVNVAGDAGRAEHDYRTRRVLPRAPEAVAAWQRELRSELLALLQVDDLLDLSIDLHPEVIEESEHDGYTECEVVVLETAGSARVGGLRGPLRLDRSATSAMSERPSRGPHRFLGAAGPRSHGRCPAGLHRSGTTRQRRTRHPRRRARDRSALASKRLQKPLAMTRSPDRRRGHSA